MRVIEVLRDGVWSTVEMEQLRKGDLFKMSGDDLCQRGLRIAKSDPAWSGPINYPKWWILADEVDNPPKNEGNTTMDCDRGKIMKPYKSGTACPKCGERRASTKFCRAGQYFIGSQRAEQDSMLRGCPCGFYWFEAPLDSVTSADKENVVDPLQSESAY